MASPHNRKASPKGKRALPADVNAALRAKHALELLLAGCRYDEIARQAGYGSRGAAWNAIRREILRQTQPLAQEAAQVEVMRLDALLLAYWSKALRGDRHAAELVLRIGERRARLLGLDYGQALHQEAEQPRTYVLGIPDSMADKPLPSMPAMPDGIPQPRPGDMVIALPQSVIDAI